MIKLNKDSWYMKATMNFHDFHPENLCQLIRYMAGSLVIYIVLTAVLAALLFFIFYPLAYLTPFATDGFVLTIGLCLDGFIAALAIRQVVEVYDWEEHWLNTDVVPKIGPVDIPLITLLWKFLVAMHDKTCPLITYKER